MRLYGDVYNQYVEDQKNSLNPGNIHNFRTENIYLKFKYWLPEKDIDYDTIIVHQGNNSFKFESIEMIQQAIRDGLIEIDSDKPWMQMYREPELWEEHRQITVHYITSKRQTEQLRKEYEERDKRRQEYINSCTFGSIDEAIKYINNEVKNNYNNEG